MKSTELRIGNYLSIDKENCIVVGIETNGFLMGKYLTPKSWTFGEPYESYKPITLTEEWLLRFGFKNTEEGFIGIHLSKGNWLEINLKTKRTIIVYKVGYIPLKNIKYVHTLQNIYHSLTQKELEIKDE